MTEKIIISAILALIVGCSSQKDLVTVKYQPTKESQNYYLDLPKNYSFVQYSISNQIENQYIYNDSSFIYITNFKNTPNYFNVKSLGDSIADYRFQNEKLTSQINQFLDSTIIIPLPDTIELKGVQANGLFWKDYKIGNVSVGYVNVPIENKSTFNKAINSIRLSKRNKEILTVK